MVAAMGLAQIRMVLFHCLAVMLARQGAAAGHSPASESALFGKVIQGIEYKADARVERSHYDPFLPMKPGDVLTRTLVQQAIQKLYEMGEFSYIGVEASPEGDAARVQFRLLFNYYFNEFKISGDVDLGGRSAWEVIPLPVGERFTPEKLEEARQAVLKYMHDRGYFLAEVQAQTRRDERERQVDTVFEVSPGALATIRSVEVRGVPSAEASTILGKLKVEKGKAYNRERVRRRLGNLKQYFLERGFLGATATIASEEFQAAENAVALEIEVSSFGEIRVTVEGFKIPKPQLRRLIPILSGGGVDEELLQEGTRNLLEHVESLGYPEADVSVIEGRDKNGVRTIQYKIEPGRKVTVADVLFRGNRAFTEEQLLAAIQIQPARFLQKSVYSVQKLDADQEALRSLYQAAGYLDARIIALPEPVKGVEQLKITFEIQEGLLAQTREVKFSGNRHLASGFLQTKIPLKQHGPYSPHLAEQARQALLAAYNDAGFLQPRVTYNVSEPDSRNTYLVEFRTEEGPQSLVDDIIVLGNRHTRASVIQKRIRFKENEPVSLGKMLQTQQGLYNTGLFDRVRVSPQNPESTAPYQDVVVRLEETRQLVFGYGLGYQETEGARGTLELSHLNIFGTGRRADVRIRGSRLEQGLVLNMQQPQILPLAVDSYFTFSARKDREISFDAKRLNLSYQFGHPLNTHSWALLRYNFRRVQVQNLKIEESALEREDLPRNLSTLSLIYVNDTRDNFFNAEKGFFTSTDLGVTTRLLGGQNDFVSLFTQTSYFKRLRGPLLLAASLRFGAAHPFGGDQGLPISERFFAGGGSSLRGFATDRAGPLDPTTNQPTGGNALLIGNLEIKIPLLRFIQLAGFFDSGNVFSNLSDIRFADFSHTLGLGLRVKTPFGPIRIDYGFNLNLPARLRGVEGFGRRQLFVTVGAPF